MSGRCFYRVMLAVGCALLLNPPGAQAQSNAQDLNIRPEQQLAQPPVANPPPPSLSDDTSHLFGSWGNFRPLLSQYGITFDVDYFAEAAGTVSGGRNTASGYADQRAVQIDFAWDKLTGLQGLATHVAFINRAGTGLSQKSTGDGLYSATEIAGGSGNVAVHLAYLYFDEVALDGRLRVAAGRLQVGTAFSASPIYCEFASLAFCAEPRPLPGSNPAFTNGTASNYGGFIRGRPLIDVYVEAGAFEASPNRGGRAGFSWSTQRSTGAMFPVEIGWEPGSSAGQLPGHYKLGFYYDTSRRSDLYYDLNGAPAVLTGAAPRQDRGQKGFWAEADQMVLRHGPGSNQGLVVFAGYAHTNGDVGVYQDEIFGGIDDHGLIPSRVQDSFGVMVTYGQQSNALIKTQELLAALGSPSEYGIAKHEVILEAEYTAHLYNGIDAGPDFQYIIRPGGSSKYPNAFIIGSQLNVKF